MAWVGGICVTAPSFPVFFTSPGSRRHDSSVNCVPSKDDITSESNFGGKGNCSQEVSCLKWVLKYDRSEAAFACIDLSDAYLDATSAISLRIPLIPITSNGADPQICCRSASARSRCPALSDFAEYFLVQCTDEELSHSIPAWRWWRLGMWHSSTSHANNTPAISRSFIDRMCSSNRRITSGGKTIDQNIYRIVPFGPGISIPRQLHICMHLSSRGHLAALVLSAPHLLACLQFRGTAIRNPRRSP